MSAERAEGAGRPGRAETGSSDDVKERIARRAALELKGGQVVNLGIGIPTRVADFIPPGVHLTFHAENGIAGAGPYAPRGAEDLDLVNAGGEYVTARSGASFFDSAIAFGIVRGGRLDVAVLGALEVSQAGDLASWKIPGKFTPGIGGSMDLTAKANRVIVVTQHTAKSGRSKLVRACSLPVTARGKVETVITEHAVFLVREGRLLLVERSRYCSVEQIVAATEAEVVVAPEVRVMEDVMSGAA